MAAVKIWLRNLEGKHILGTATVNMTVNHRVSDVPKVLVPLGSSSPIRGAKKKEHKLYVLYFFLYVELKQSPNNQQLYFVD